jgi:hypothetical protein
MQGPRSTLSRHLCSATSPEHLNMTFFPHLCPSHPFQQPTPFLSTPVPLTLSEHPPFCSICAPAVDPPEEGSEEAAAAAATLAAGRRGGRRARDDWDTGLAVVAGAGLRAVRGGEVVEVRDENGDLMNDFTGRVRLDKRKPPAGEWLGDALGDAERVCGGGRGGDMTERGGQVG